MAHRTFEIATEPHIADVGPHTLHFMPEAPSSTFVEAFDAMRERMKEAGADDAGEGGDPAGMIAASIGFLAAFAQDDETTAILEKEDLPLRALGQLTNWLIQLYGSGENAAGDAGSNAARPTGSSSGSRRASPKTGTASTRTSSSRASTSTRSRRAG